MFKRRFAIGQTEMVNREDYMMKIFIMLTMIFILFTVEAPASTIILKDGRNITGDILEQNNAKVVIKFNDVSVTFYQDEIVSIDGKPFVGKSPSKVGKRPSIKPDPEKEKLVDQFLKMPPTTEDMVIAQTQGTITPEQKDRFLSFLKENSDIQKFTEIRRAGMMQYFSSASLKAIINFRTSPEGEAYFKEAKIIMGEQCLNCRT